MGKDFADIFNSSLGLMVLLLFLVLAVIVTPFFLLGAALYVAVRLYLESPARLERVARKETEVLYQHALSGSVVLSTSDIDDLLSASWPPDVPAPLKEQLLLVGRALFADEGLSPNVPPVPALCNTVEGARYRDYLARLGQARSDPVMVETALSQIGESLGVIANAVPKTTGDVLVGVTQFLEPLGPAIEAIITPFYADTGYIHFKALRTRLDANLERTHRALSLIHIS